MHFVFYGIACQRSIKQYFPKKSACKLSLSGTLPATVHLKRIENNIAMPYDDLWRCVSCIQTFTWVTIIKCLGSECILHTTVNSMSRVSMVAVVMIELLFDIQHFHMNNMFVYMQCVHHDEWANCNVNCRSWLNWRLVCPARLLHYFQWDAQCSSNIPECMPNDLWVCSL